MTVRGYLTPANRSSWLGFSYPYLDNAVLQLGAQQARSMAHKL